MKRASSIPPQRSTFRSSEARSLHSSMYFDRIRPSSSLTDGTARKTTARTVPGDFQDDPSCTATAAQSFWNAIISSTSFPEKVCSRPCECSIHSLKPNNLSYTQQPSTSVSLSINSELLYGQVFPHVFPHLSLRRHLHPPAQLPVHFWRFFSSFLSSSEVCSPFSYSFQSCSSPPPTPFPSPPFPPSQSPPPPHPPPPSITA